MKKETIEDLNEERSRRLDNIARQLLNDDEDIDDVTWVEKCSKILSSTPPTIKWKRPFTIACICLAFVGLACTIPISQTFMDSHVSFEVEAENIVLTLNKNWTLNQQLTVDTMIIDNIRDTTGSKKITLKGSGIDFEELTLLAGAEIELSEHDDEVHMFVKNSPVSVMLNVWKAEKEVKINGTSAGKDPIEIDLNKNPSKTLQFNAEASAAPIELRFITQKKWQLHNLQVQTIRFLEEYPHDSGEFESAVRSGKVMLRDTGIVVELFEADSLTLKNLKSKRVELSKADNGVRVVFEGTVREVNVGPKGFEEGLAPTWLDYLYHQQRIKLFWGALIFLFVFLTNIHEVISGIIKSRKEKSE